MKRVNISSKGKKAAVLCLSGALVTTMCLGIGWKENRESGAYAASKTEKAIEKNYPQITPSVSDRDGVMKKDETIYVIQDANGVQQKLYAEEWLQNGKKLDKISDKSSLKDIKNTTGTETFDQDGHTLVWNANGSDIRYEGTPSEDLPVSVTVSYYLNGKRMTADQIAGKSGNVEIRFHYDVHKTDVVKVNGKSYSIQHPYTMASGVMLDNSHFTDIKLSNGKSVSDGNHTVCLGVAFPGLQESLNLTSGDLDIPEDVTIKARTDEFKIDGTYTAALDGVLSDINLSELTGKTSKLDELTDGLTQLSDASAKLVNGTDKLKGGADELLAGSKTLQNGTASLVTGANALATGSSQLASGSSKLNAGILSLSNGLGQLSSNSKALREATYRLEDQIFKSASSEMNKALKAQNLSTTVTLTPSNYVETISGLSGSALKAADAQIRAALSKAGVSDSSTQTTMMSLAYNQIMTAKNSGKTLTTEEGLSKAGEIAKAAKIVQGASSNAELQKAAVAQLGADANKTQIAALTTAMYLQKQGLSAEAAQTKAKEYLNQASLYQDAESHKTENADALKAYAAVSNSDAKAASESMKSAKTQLDSVVAYVKAVETYTAGVDSAYEGSKKLVSGAKSLQSGATQLSKGAAELAAGAKKLNNGSGKLTEGLNTLANGAGTLSNGMRTFDQNGIKKLTGSLKGKDLTEAVNRMEAVVQVSERSELIGGLSHKMSGESRLVFKTAEVE